ncbi:glutamate formimidoyltransferase [candidate division KSB3 bacterium]|uniref:Formimidoyltransferase-cyclodeaminase n=1 Tax=candidate division KSB3 bacterium TaxID=2044937 RepID=A0A9D5JVG9_9BACT|nr:glutamate formimidoyltransferase [candidate division KSB3 bacterium]MBD3324888.1 glutamate formimidoyltransferase [candidate division KSB3 bacterium]
MEKTGSTTHIEGKLMQKIVECVPNFSEGRRPEIVEALLQEIRDLAGAYVLDSEMDADHNRAVITLVGGPEAVKEAAFRMIKTAAACIDLTVHTGEHPRMGATDVVPFIPVQNMTMAECVQLAQELGQRVGEELEIPVYLYEHAAMRPERKNLAQVRKGQFEGLREAIGTHPDRVPDYGPNRIHPTAGATAIGARFFLVAYNVNLDSDDLPLAKRIVKTIRASSGGLSCVKAMGVELTDRHLVQVSMNLVDYRITSLATAYTAIRKEAEQAGVSIVESEVIGLVPQAALTDAAVELLQIRNFSRDQIIEHRIAELLNDHDASEDAFLHDLASAAPAPGGGSASAMAGALAAALTTMVCHLTVGKPTYQDVADELADVREQAQQLQRRLTELITEDSRAYEAVMAAFKRPKATDADKARRRDAIQQALQQAATTPLDTMRQALEVLKLAALVAEKGNPNAITDAGCAVHLAQAAIGGAALNVNINLRSIRDPDVIHDIDTELAHIQTTAETLAQQAFAIIASTMRDA